MSIISCPNLTCSFINYQQILVQRSGRKEGYGFMKKSLCLTLLAHYGLWSGLFPSGIWQKLNPSLNIYIVGGWKFLPHITLEALEKLYDFVVGLWKMRQESRSGERIKHGWFIKVLEEGEFTKIYELASLSSPGFVSAGKEGTNGTGLSELVLLSWLHRSWGSIGHEPVYEIKDAGFSAPLLLG